MTSLAKDYAKIHQFRYDSEMTADMYYQIANSHLGNAPDLRLANLESLSKIHIESSNFAEASLCILAGSRLILEYLSISGKLVIGVRDTSDPINGVNIERLWSQCSTNLTGKEIPEISLLKEEGVCQGDGFSEVALCLKLEKACGFLKKALLFETGIQVYKLLLWIYDTSKQFDKCARVHGELKEFYEEILRTVSLKF